MTKPDRYERMVLAEMKKRGLSPISEDDLVIWLNAPDIVKLLRREHTWMVRMVKKVYDWQAEQLADDADACEVILEQLEKRKK